MTGLTNTDLQLPVNAPATALEQLVLLILSQLERKLKTELNLVMT